jgi:homoserine dehydrogenase
MNLNIGLLGFGTVGQGVAKILQKGQLQKKTGATIVIKKILVKNPEKRRDVQTKAEFVTDFTKISKDPSINIIIEVMGGIEPAREYISRSLKAGKSVVTANKTVISSYWDELHAIAEKSGSHLLFEAAVGGCIPIIKTVQHTLACDKISSIYGILNGTTNYILTKMSLEKKSYEYALKNAQELGFAEADPSFDVEGIDTAQKLAIVTAATYGLHIDPASIYTEGISKITPEDITFADDWGYCIKLIALAQMLDDGLDLRVHPVMILKDHPLASVNNEYNAVFIESDNSGQQMLFGRGAGQLPTASAVMCNVVDIIRGLRYYPIGGEKVGLVDFKDLEMEYYMRFWAVDKPGVLSKISGVLAEFGISIAQVVQTRRGEDFVPVVLKTHKAKEDDVRSAVARIDSLQVIKGHSVLIRIL